MDTKEEIIRQFEAQTAPLSPETHEKLANILVRFELAKGDLFLREGEICKYYSMVAQGMIRLFYDKNGRDLTEHFSYEKGIFVSLESYFRQTPSYLMIEALEPTVIYSFPHDQLQDLIRAIIFVRRWNSRKWVGKSFTRVEKLLKQTSSHSA